MKGNGTAYVSSDRDREVVVVDVSLADRGPPDQAHQARRQRARDDARRVAVEAVRRAGQRRPGRGHRHVDQHGDRQDRRARARPACCRRPAEYTGAATFAVTLSPDGETLYAVNSGANSIAVIPLTGAQGVHGQRPDPDRLRAARHHLQRRRLVDVHRQRQERHRARTPATWPATRPHHRASSIRAATRRPRPRARPRTSTSSSWSGRRWSARRCRRSEHLSDLTEQVAKNNFYSTDDRRQRREGDGVPAQAHQARDLHRQGEPHLRSDPRRPEQRRERRSEH